MNWNLEKIKKSIIDLKEKSEIEKKNLSDSIEMMWLNADVQRRKEELDIPENSKNNVNRIRQLLACAWSEDLKK